MARAAGPRERNTAKTRLRVGSRTDVGRVRPHNEDSLLVEPPVFVVADGVGGSEAGEIASNIAVRTMSERAPKIADTKALGEAVEIANQAILEAVERGEGRWGMGTTMTAAVIDGDRMAVAQVGDSRAYRMRAGHLEQLTHDHSLVAAMVESGQITEHEALAHPSRSIITRALGSDPEMFADLYEFEMLPGDRVLMCSDGLCGILYKEDIENILLDSPHPQKAADRLVEAANLAGGTDNITVIVIDIVSTGTAARPASATEQRERAEESSNKKRRRLGIIVFCVVAVALVGCAIAGFTMYVRGSAYLIEQDGRVAVYSGRIDSFMGIGYSEFQYLTDIEVDDLSPLTAERLADGVQFDSMDEAIQTLNSYAQQATSANASQESSDDADTNDTTSEDVEVQSDDTAGDQ